MEIASGKWLSDLELMEDPTLFSQYHQMMNPIECSFNDDFNFQPLSSSAASYSFYPNMDHKIWASHHQVVDDDLITSRPTKQVKTNNSCFTIKENIPPKASSNDSHIISFDNSNSLLSDQQYYGLVDCDVKLLQNDGNMGYVNNIPSNLIPQSGFKQVEKKAPGSLSRTPILAQDHVIAERKRREKISQSFISLSALIPHLKKTDKNSILEETIKYMKQLKEQVTTLEKQVAKKRVESVTFVRKTQINADDETSSSDENFDNQSNNNTFPHEIEARVSDKDVLIRIHCEKNRGSISNIIKEIENLHLTVLNSNVLPFGQSTLDITIVAQMEAEFSMTVKDLVKSLRQALLKIM